MDNIKDTARSTVRIGYDGSVYKTFRGHLARERYENECRVLKYLEEKGCNFVPRLLDQNDEKLSIVTTNSGTKVAHVGADRLKELFAELETFGVRHDDPYVRNVTYHTRDGRFHLIDFEFSTILEHPELSPPIPEPDFKP